MKILVTGHGRFAEGICSAANIIAGELKDVTFINSYVDEVDFKTELEKYFDNNNDVLVLTDLFGGSVNQAVMQYMNRNNSQIITGVNLPLVLEIFVANNNGCLTNINEMIANSQTQLINVNDAIKNVSSDDDFD